MSELAFKKMTLKDSSALSALEGECFSCPWSEDSFIECLDNDRYCFIGLYEDGELVGYCGLLSIFEVGDIVNIAVRSDKRRRGYGEMLMTALENEAKAREVSTLFLEVRESNSSARRLYEKLGYTFDGLRKNYYVKPQENAVIMKKQL